ncbi:Cdc37 N terminal kinase binding-domain-containing protein [Lipomyces chichibuensis]|uniref:Cdc37 N terminal kinase binding-domain-containing protein n=1 Tax=Lipomyces chichibuensis TaxID=1546026 RepID=UPI00334323FD
MVVDYSKWDKLELSDDSDVEVHPNVDKKSFIRWKQRDIHEKRQQRHDEIETLKAENQMNSNLLSRMQKLIRFLKAVPEGSGNEKSAIDTILKDAYAESSSGPVEGNPHNGPSYADMMKSLVDQVEHEASGSKSASYCQTLITNFEMHYKKLSELQEICVKKLTDLQNEETKHITSDDIHIGFDSTRVSKASHPEPAPSTSLKRKGKQVQEIEVLNAPSVPSSENKQSDDPDAGDEADDEREASGEDEDEDEEYKISPIAQEFTAIKMGDYQKCLEFIGKHPHIVAEEEADGVLFEAFGKEMAGKHIAAKRHVHNALLLQYCARLGQDGVTVFFRKIMTPGHPSLGAFMQDVEYTYNHIKERSKVLLEEQKSKTEEVEEIINLEELSEKELADLGLTKEDIERFKSEQVERDAEESARLENSK